MVLKKKNKFYFFWLSLICAVVFFLQMIPTFTDRFILNDKANNGEFWRFLTAIFLHGSLSHLLLNLVALLFFGIILEKTIGSRRFLIVFFSSGILANLVSVNYYDSSLGASGAIYGIIGALTVIRPFMLVWAFGLMMPMFLASVLWVIGDILRMQGAFGPSNIGAIAHLSGVLVGFLLGFYWTRDYRERSLIRDKLIVNEKDFRNWENRFIKG